MLDLAQVTPHVSGPDTVQIMASLAEMEKQKVAIQKAYLLSCVNSRIEDLAAAARVLQGKKVAHGVKLYLGAASKWVQEEAERRGIWQTLLDAGAHPLPAGCGPCIGLGVGLLEAGEVGISATNRNFKGRMGSRDAKCYLASPEVVAASALAGYIRGPFKISGAHAGAKLPGISRKRRGGESRNSSRLPRAGAGATGIPAAGQREHRCHLWKGLHLPRRRHAGDDGEGRDGELRSAVCRAHAPGDVIVSGFNFGTGSSREQAVTCLKAKGIPLVIAASFSQTYLRNAYNNGFLCIEVPELVKRTARAICQGSGGERKDDYSWRRDRY